jgi:hypothetical protein
MGPAVGPRQPRLSTKVLSESPIPEPGSSKSNPWAPLSQGRAFYDLPSAPYRQACCINASARRNGDQRKERNMWKVGDVEPVRVMGAEGYPYGFNVTTEDGKSLKV